MAHKYCFEALDRTLKDIMRENDNSDLVFCGKVVVFGGDFRQILLVFGGDFRQILPIFGGDFRQILFMLLSTHPICGTIARL